MTNDFKIHVVAWSGLLSELAANFKMDQRVLATELRRLTTASPAKGRLSIRLDSPTALKTLRHRLEIAKAQSNSDSP